MSSMLRCAIASALLASVAVFAVPLQAQDATYDAADWDKARANLVARQPGRMAQAVSLWQQLTASKSYGFGDYANFLLTYPGFPDADKLQGFAEDRLRVEGVASDRLVAFFTRYPPKSNFARAQFALAQLTLQAPAGLENARAAWRGGEMDPGTDATLQANYGRNFTQADQDARMDALLWQRNSTAAGRQLAWTSPAKRAQFQARLAILQGGDGFTTDPTASADPGYLYNRSRELRTEGRSQDAVNLLANHPRLASLPFDQTAWVGELLSVARLGGAREAVRIADSVDQAFAPGTDISTKEYELRDDYTSLVWLGAAKAWELGDFAAAAALFYRYAAAARTSPTKTKGLYWAGLAAGQAGDQMNAKRYLELAAQYPDRFYGQLALERLGRPLMFLAAPNVTPSDAERAAFLSQPITQAVTEVARNSPWSVGIRFYREIAEQADTLKEGVLVAQLARDIGRRDLAVILANAADSNGFSGFTTIGFPTLVAPPGTDWTMVHAITRQESQFANNAISYAGARGLMQLMPGTAREQAGKNGVAYMSASLVEDPAYNIRLGNGYFQRMLNYYGGSYPLAVAAYNAGPGNVNKWLRQNGDPRTGAIRWIDWIERIPVYQTKDYVQRVLENAVVYETLHPEKAPGGRARSLSQFLR
jgi:soluble lytic murein transglycosylase